MESGTGELAIRTTGREVVTVATGVESGTGELAIRTTRREVVTVSTEMESGTGECEPSLRPGCNERRLWQFAGLSFLIVSGGETAFSMLEVLGNQRW
jgi:hypothetical protein